MENLNLKVNLENVDFERIYKYTDVSMFKLHQKNRKINEALVRKYKNSMLNGASDNLIGLMMIDVKTKQIYDGQHRIEAYKQAKEMGFNRPLQIRYINAPEKLEDQIDLIVKYNSGTHWIDKDFINTHMGGDNDLSRLRDFCLKHKRLFKEMKTGKNKGTKNVFFRRGAAIVTGDPTYYKKALKDGTFKASKEKWDEASKVHSEVMKILDATKLSGQSDVPALEGIINGWYAVRNNIYFIRKIDNLPNKLEDVYKYMTPENMDVRHTTSANIWKHRFETAIENAYNEFC